LINTALRLFPPANIIPKRTASTFQVLKYKDRTIEIPGDTAVNILTASTHLNPNYWPQITSSFQTKSDLDEFRPERWFTETLEGFHKIDSGIDLGDGESFTGRRFFTPIKGSFIPFSIGQRECVGKRFAQVEMLVVLAVIFRDWRVELVTDENFSCESDGLRRLAWEMARDAAKNHLRNGMEHYMTMQLGKDLVRLKLVKRDEGTAC
jgi:cytochrome P450